MAKRNTISEQSSRNPSVVLRAFAPETEYEVTLDGWMFMEALGLALTRGERPTTRELILAMLVLTDLTAVKKAHRGRKLELLIAEAAKGKSVGDIMAYTAKVTEAVEAAFEPTDSGADGEKKSSAAPDGGSPS
jgi:hypothetical protein